VPERRPNLPQLRNQAEPDCARRWSRACDRLFAVEVTIEALKEAASLQISCMVVSWQPRYKAGPGGVQIWLPVLLNRFRWALATSLSLLR
jgi:hypothetical protein